MPTFNDQNLRLPKSAKVLILGGTEEARELAAKLDQRGHDVTTSQKGATKKRLQIAGKLRIGGFSSDKYSSAEGLTNYLREAKFDVLVDATHPFALNISPRAQKVCAQLNLPYLRLERPPWQPEPEDNWTCVDQLDDALAALPEGARCFAALGRQQILALSKRPDCQFFARAIEARPDCPENVAQIIDRPPFSLSNELALFKELKITHLITKNAGGDQTKAKLEAARKLNINLIMINRAKNQPKQDASSAIQLIDAYF